MNGELVAQPQPHEGVPQQPLLPDVCMHLPRVVVLKIKRLRDTRRSTHDSQSRAGELEAQGRSSDRRRTAWPALNMRIVGLAAELRCSAMDELVATSLDNPKGAFRASYRYIEQPRDDLPMTADDRVCVDFGEGLTHCLDRAIGGEAFIGQHDRPSSAVTV